MIHIKRIDELFSQNIVNETWYDDCYLSFYALKDSTTEERRKGLTYCLCDNMSDKGNDKWNVAVFVKSVREEWCLGERYVSMQR